MSCFHASMPLQAERKLEQRKSQRYLLTFRDELEMLQGAMRKTLVTNGNNMLGPRISGSRAFGSPYPFRGLEHVWTLEPVHTAR